MKNRSKGLNIQNSLQKHPEIARYLNLYEQCRNSQLFSMESSKGSGKSATRVIKVVSVPSGYGILPNEGGLLDQPFRMWQHFEIFYSVEREEAFKKLSS